MGAAVTAYFGPADHAAVAKFIADSTNLDSNIRSINATRVMDPFGRDRIIILIGERHTEAFDIGIAAASDFLESMCGSGTRVDLFLEESVDYQPMLRYPNQTDESIFEDDVPLDKVRVRARIPCENIRAHAVDARGTAFEDICKLNDVARTLRDADQALLRPHINELMQSLFRTAFLSTERICRKYLRDMPPDAPTTRGLQAYFDEFFVAPIDETLHSLQPLFIGRLTYQEVFDRFVFLMDIYCVFRMMKRDAGSEDSRFVFYGGEAHAANIRLMLHTCIAASGADPNAVTIASWSHTFPEYRAVSFKWPLKFSNDVHEAVRARLGITVPAWKPQETYKSLRMKQYRNGRNAIPPV